MRNKEQILRHVINCLDSLYNPRPNDGLTEFRKNKETYYSLEEEWKEVTGAGRGPFGPFRVTEENMKALEARFLLNFKIMRSEDTGEPKYSMLSGNSYINIPQRKRKVLILKLALESNGISLKELFPSRILRYLRFGC